VGSTASNAIMNFFYGPLSSDYYHYMTYNSSHVSFNNITRFNYSSFIEFVRFLWTEDILIVTRKIHIWLV